MQDGTPPNFDHSLQQLFMGHVTNARVINHYFPSTRAVCFLHIPPRDFRLWNFLKDNVYRTRPVCAPLPTDRIRRYVLNSNLAYVAE